LVKTCHKYSKVLRVQTKFTPSDAVSPPEATGGLLHEGCIAIGEVRFGGLGIMQQDTSGLENYT